MFFSMEHNLIKVSLINGINVAPDPMIGQPLVSIRFYSKFLSIGKTNNRYLGFLGGFLYVGNVNNCSDIILTVNNKWMVQQRSGENL